MWKTQKKAVSNILVPPPSPDVPTDPNDQTQQSATDQNPVSMVTGVINNNIEVPSLDEEMAATVTSKVAKC